MAAQHERDLVGRLGLVKVVVLLELASVLDLEPVLVCRAPFLLVLVREERVADEPKFLAHRGSNAKDEGGRCGAGFFQDLAARCTDRGGDEPDDGLLASDAVLAQWSLLGRRSIEEVMRDVISLFTGAGGLDLGFEAAGFRTAVAVEQDPEAVATVRANRDWNVLLEDVHSEAASPEALLRAGHLGEGEAALLIGGPPCQPFSKSGYWHSGDSKRLQDPRAQTLDAYFRVLRAALPEAFLLENVPGMAFSEKSEGLDFVKDQVARINVECGTNYQIAAAELNSVEYGVPQARRRVFVVAHREGRPFRFPAPTHAPPPKMSMATGEVSGSIELPFGLEECTSSWDAIGHLEDDDDPELRPTGKWADLLPSIPEGRNYLFHTDRGGGLPLFGWRRHFWSMLLKVAKDRPSWTLTAKPGPAIGPFHWKSRRFSAAELCALQTFPAGYEILGSIRSVQRQVGNAVPSAMAEVLGLAMRAQFFDDLEVDPSSPSLVPARRRPCPSPEVVLDVPQKYLHRVGKHSAHPGTGLGRGAQSRSTAK